MKNIELSISRADIIQICLGKLSETTRYALNYACVERGKVIATNGHVMYMADSPRHKKTPRTLCKLAPNGSLTATGEPLGYQDLVPLATREQKKLRYPDWQLYTKTTYLSDYDVAGDHPSSVIGVMTNNGIALNYFQYHRLLLAMWRHTHKWKIWRAVDNPASSAVRFTCPTGVTILMMPTT
jgi:hypothetical protein